MDKLASSYRHTENGGAFQLVRITFRYDNCVIDIHMGQIQQVSTRMCCYYLKSVAAMCSVLLINPPKKGKKIRTPNMDYNRDKTMDC